ncbi:MAG: DUF488 domain-containing protein [archaeon]
MIKLKRVYEEYDKQDGFRVLVDRLWPRGISKDSARIDLWLKEAAPSSDLRKYFCHDPEKWEDFKKLYRAELSGKKELLDELKKAEKENSNLTLLYGAKDTEHNQAVVLADVLKKHSRK